MRGRCASTSTRRHREHRRRRARSSDGLLAQRVGFDPYREAWRDLAVLHYEGRARRGSRLRYRWGGWVAPDAGDPRARARAAADRPVRGLPGSGTMTPECALPKKTPQVDLEVR